MDPEKNSFLINNSDGNSDVLLFEQKDNFRKVFSTMEEIRRMGKLCDVTLKVDDQCISAHRIVLASTMPYFQAMFCNDMIESKQREIPIQGIESRALEALINFAYNGRVQIDSDNVQALMVGASFLQLYEVREACADYLHKRLHPSNVLGIRQFADSLGCRTLVENSEMFVQQNFSAVAEGDEFSALSAREVQSLIRRDELAVSSEEEVFEAVMRWVKRDVKTRTPFLPSLLAHVRMPLLSPQFLTDRVAKEEFIRSSHECRDLVDEARDYHLMPERRPLLENFKMRPRHCYWGYIFAIGGLAKSGDSLSTVEAYDPVREQWTLSEAMSMLRSRVGVAVMHDRLYAIGGFNGTERLATVEVFDSSKKSWSQVSPMQCKRSAMGAAALNDYLYVCGGYDGITSLNTVEKYNPMTDTWTPVPPMMKHRSAGGVLAFDGCIYALGGHDGLSIFDLVEKYDPRTNQWVEVTPMLTRRCRLGVATLNGKLYVCGGYDGSTFLQSVEMYDPITNCWKNVAPMNIKRSRVALVANVGMLWAIGGYDGASNLSTVEVYNPATDTWKYAASMCAHEGGVGVGVIPIS